MSGGRLVLLDRLGRDARVFPLAEGLATIGSDPGCDIRLLLPTVSPHHATVVVHANQTVVSSMAAGELLVNGASAGVAALRHGDRLAVGGRTLRWDYDDPASPASERRARGGRRRHSAQPRAAPPTQSAQPRASMPASSSGKQVAIVQPQRRDAGDGVQEEGSPSSKRVRLAHHSHRSSPGARLKDTKASLWIESRKRPRVTKIRAPARIDHTKRAALMLMAGHTPRPKGGRPRSLPGLAGGGRAPRRHTGSGGSLVGATSGGESSPIFQPSTAGPKKSSLKNPSAKRSTRKPESIKFDLSNLEQPADRAGSDEELSLHYSDSPGSPAPAPRRALLSRGGRMLLSLGAAPAGCPAPAPSASPATASSPARKSSRGSLILERALGNSTLDDTRGSRGTAETLSDESYRTTLESARQSRARSSRASNRDSEAYSIVDLVSSAGSERTTGSAYGSAGSGPPPACSTPRAPLATPENSQSFISTGTGISRVSRSRSRMNDSLVPDDDESPRSSRRSGRSELASPILGKTVTESTVGGAVTPEERGSPEEVATPVLSIRNLLNRSPPGRSSRSSRRLPRASEPAGGVGRRRKASRLSVKSRSLLATSKRASRGRPGSSTGAAGSASAGDEDEAVTPTSAVRPVQEAVKNKHSSAKKTQSMRSIIDNLDESELVKQLFNSPVKRKLSQSMTEFSRKKLFEDDNDSSALTACSAEESPRTPDASLSERTAAFTPGVFVSPLSPAGRSPDAAGLKRLFGNNTPENDLQNVRGMRALVRSPRTRRSVRNDLTDVSGVKKLFARSPKNSFSDVRLKELFTSSPKNDLRRVSGVKSLFRMRHNSPKNSLENLAGVKELFKNNPLNDLQNVSGARNALRLRSPRNDLSDVRGVKRMYRDEANANNLSDVSGVEELFQESQTSDSTFDRLRGELRVRSYTKSRSSTGAIEPKQRRNAKSLHDSIGLITDNVEEWLEIELEKRFHRDTNESSAKRSLGKSNLTRELQKLSTATVEGGAPLLAARSRNGTLARGGLSEAAQRKKSASEIYSAHTLPIKKRSLAEANRSGGAAGLANRLPIKKRTLVHSTPVKGRVSLMNGSELGPVSPIAAVRKAADVAAATVGSPKTKRGKSSSIEYENSESVKVVSKKTSGTKPLADSPDRGDGQELVRYSRRNTKVILTRNTRKRRVSAVTKKKPLPSPEPDTEKLNSTSEDEKNKIKSNQIYGSESRVEEKSKKVRKTRANVGKTDATVSGSARQIQGTALSKTVLKTPRNTRAKSRKGLVVNTRLSMRLKPQNVQRNTNNEDDNEQGSTIDVRSPRSATTMENVNNTNATRRTRYGNKKTTNVINVVRKQPKRKPTDVNPNVSKEQPSGDHNLPKGGEHIANAVDNKPRVTVGKKIGMKTVAAQTENTEGRTTRRNRNKVIPIPVIEPSIDVAANMKTRRRLRKDAVEEQKLTKDKIQGNITGRTRRGAKSKEIEIEASTSKHTTENTNANDNTRKTRTRNVAQAKSQEDVTSARTRRGRGKGKGTESGDAQTSDTRKAKENDKTKKIPQRNIINDTNTELIVGKRTRRTKKENNIENTTRRGKKPAEEESAAVEVEEAVGRRTRTARGAKGGRPDPVQAVAAAPTRTAAARRNKKVDVDEAGSHGPEGRPRRGARAAAAKRANDAASGEEAPAKRQRTTRAAAASADGRSRSRR